MAYYHVLTHREESSSKITLLHKDLTEEQVRAPSMLRFIRNAQRGADSSAGDASSLRASVIRTERRHDEAVTEYLREWGEKAEEFMRASGYPVNSQPMGDSAIAGAGIDVTASFLREPVAPQRDEVPEEARKRFEIWARNAIPLGSLVRILTLVHTVPNHRSTPRKGDRRDRHYDAWFDGGAIVTPTGGASEYWFDDGACATLPGPAPRLDVEIEWPDGRVISIRQDSDRADYAEYVPAPPPVQAVPRNRGFNPTADQIDQGMMMRYESGDPRREGKVWVRTLSKRDLHDDGVKRQFRCFCREVCASRRVEHANIVRVLYSGEDGDVIFLGTEHIDCRRLLDFFDANERFRIGDAVTLMGELCAALHAAHVAGIVHCSVTPASVIIDAKGCAKLGAFGFARFDGAEAAENEPDPDPGRTSEMIGAPAYMSPEAISDAPLDRRTDIFSAGAILYRLLTGQQAFAGPGAWTTAKQVLQQDPPPPSSINKAVSPLFDAVVAKALAKDPGERYQTAAGLDIALQSAFRESGSGRS